MLAGELEGAQAYLALSTATERRLAGAWSKVLGIPQDEVGRRDSFFDRGGTSLTAVKLVIALDRAVSLKDITQNPILADLARFVDGADQRHGGLLQPLSNPDGGQTEALICFPYAGGNAVNFQPMATALRESGLAIYAVELPGHDVAGESEPFASIAHVVEQVVAEILDRGLRTVLLWGHSSGSALAVATARKLHEHEVDVRRVFLGAQLLGRSSDRRAAIAELAELSDGEIAAWLRTDAGHAGLAELGAEQAEQAGAAYRHDCMSAHRYLADALDSLAPAKLSAPVTVVVAADDPSTAQFPHLYRDWQLLAEHVELCELADGGHYFPRTCPTETAQALLGALGAEQSLVPALIST